MHKTAKSTASMTPESNQHALNLVDTTVRAFNGDVTSISIIDSVSLIDSWISVLRDQNDQTTTIADGLSNLKAALQSGNPDGEQIQQILTDLVEQTRQVTNSDPDDTTKVNALADALQSFSQQVSGASGPANTGGQAPLTSTVGGESTNSGTGNSAADSSNDPLADRTGGTISNEATPGQNEEADSSQASGTGGAATTGDNATDTTGDDYTKSTDASESRSDTGRVEGPGISGGTGDTDASQSGGRSQY